MTVELALHAAADLAEGPVWDPDAGRLCWVDITRGEVHRFDPATGQDSSFRLGEEVGAVASRGRRAGARPGRRFRHLRRGRLRPTRPARIDTEPAGGRMNDGKCDPAGRFWAGTLHGGVTGAAALHRLDPDGLVHTVLTGLTVSNGLGWSPDGRTMYHVDTPTGGVDAYDYDLDTGRLARRRRLVTVQRGKPDGLTVDADGGLWVALWGGWAVQRFTPDGRLDRTVDVPVERVTSCGFGGDDLGTLYITTAGRGVPDPAREPHAGGIFAVDPAVPGLPPTAWAG